MKKLIFISLLWLVFSTSFGQNGTKLESLLADLQMTESVEKKIELIVQISAKQDALKDKLVYAKYAKQLAMDSGKPTNLVEAYHNFARIYAKSNKDSISTKWVDKSVIQLDDIEISDYKGTALLECAEIYTSLGRRSQAKFQLEKAIEVFMITKDIKSQVIARNLLGINYKNSSEFVKAIQCYHLALALAKEGGFNSLEASVLLNIGVVNKNDKNFDEALNYYDLAERKYVEIGNKKGIAKCQVNKGNVYRANQNFQKASKSYLEALNIADSLEDKKIQSYVFNNMGLVYKSQEKYELALSSFRQSLEIKENEKDIYNLTSTYRNIASVCEAMGRNEEADQYYQYALENAEKYQILDDLEEVYLSLAKYNKKKGDLSISIEFYDLYQQQNEENRQNENRNKLKELQAIYNNNKQQQQITALELQQKQESESRKFASTRNNLIIVSLLTILSLLALLLYGYYRRLNSAKKSKIDLMDAHERLRETLISKEEKELLLKEIHHRVKNNMQIITSLLRLQSSKIEGEKLQVAFAECEARVKAMALVHEELYKTDDLANVNLKQYLKRLCVDIIKAYSLDEKIKLKLNVKVNSIGIDTLIPLGLLINEIITNSLQHGFKSNVKEGGVIKLDLEFSDFKEYCLTISDNGSGIDNVQVFLASDSLGIELIQTLTEQLEGTLDLASDENGTTYKIIFKNQDIEEVVHG